MLVVMLDELPKKAPKCSVSLEGYFGDDLLSK